MNAGTKRVAIAAGALAAAGLFGSLPFDGSTVAQSGVPVQQHDVALVDSSGALDSIVTTEISLDDAIYGNVFGSTGLEDKIYDAAVSSLGAPEADTLLGTTVLLGAHGIFDGAASNFGQGALLDAWAAENEVDSMLGVSSETPIYADVIKDFPFLALTSGFSPTETTSAFDASLMSLATSDLTTGATELHTYLTDLLASLGSGGLGELGGLGGLLGDLTGGLL